MTLQTDTEPILAALTAFASNGMRFCEVDSVSAAVLSIWHASCRVIHRLAAVRFCALDGPQPAPAVIFAVPGHLVAERLSRVALAFFSRLESNFTRSLPPNCFEKYLVEPF